MAEAVDEAAVVVKGGKSDIVKVRKIFPHIRYQVK